MTALRARLLTPTSSSPELRFEEDALVVVGDDGRIASVARYDPGATRKPVLDLRPRVILPGLVDAHVHFPQTRIVGSATGPLLDWLSATVFPEEARFREAAYARAVARELVARLIAVGTTCASIFSSSDAGATEILFEELAASGLRAIAGLTLMDQACPDALRVPRDVAIAKSAELATKWEGFDGGRLGYSVTPRFAISCSRALMEDAARLASDRDLRVQTHVSENAAEGVETLAVHPFAKDYLGVYEAVGLIGPRTILAHAIHLSPSEWDRVAAKGARVAHCPDSNFFLGSGRMRVSEARSRGIPIGLGSDVAAGRSFDMRRAIAHAYDNALAAGVDVTPEELVRMATLGGAEALGLGEAIGSVEPGKDADLVVVDVPAYVESVRDVVAKVAFGSEAARVDRAYVRGKRLGIASN